MTTPVTDIDLVKLRMVALGDDKRSLDQNITDFRTMITPQAVLALLDRLERAEKERGELRLRVALADNEVWELKTIATKAEANLISAVSSELEACAQECTRLSDLARFPSAFNDGDYSVERAEAYDLAAQAIRARAQAEQEKA